jgi:hypothetical protein
MSATTNCTAAFEIVTKVGFGPVADESARGGKQTFAANANERTGFRKAGLRFTCRDVRFPLKALQLRRFNASMARDDGVLGINPNKAADLFKSWLLEEAGKTT